ncbi:LacI family DNA-binding transcriptional regulator [Sanguibacter sp. Leaf3]|uniref:LacI family DNA-binding transcriptional regulator n=1 Tax=Sanguibacter sp. Leaf3 TaxID=1736209 RepID=UPI0006F68835|nr:LacI family DNA-binding transcriptional regulator [Sanguibacter sp. Leaf3]KQT98443.1 hypothetical protein ASG53_12415 [Sanguibacter sp. Leaf3]
MEPQTPTRNRRATAADVASAAGVSRATVGFVLNNTHGQTISAPTRERVRAAAEGLGYRPHAGAQALARGSSTIVIFVLPDWPLDHSMRAHLEAARAALDVEGYSLVTYTRHQSSKARPLWEVLDPAAVVGMMPFTPDELAGLRRSGVTRVFPATSVVESGADQVVDLDTAVRLQVDHLAELGHRRLAYALSTDERLTSLGAERLQTAQGRARELGLPELDVRHLPADRGETLAAVTAWIGADVTGVVAYNDDIASLVSAAAQRLGASVPEDLAIVGYDDTPLAALQFPALTSVRVDTEGLGRALAEIALALIQDRAVPVWDVDAHAVLVRREST